MRVKSAVRRGFQVLGLFILTAFCGDVVAQTTGPTEPRTITNLALSGSSTAWLNPSNCGSSDGDHASIVSGGLSANNSFTDYLHASDFGFSIPSGSHIEGITVEIERGDLNNCKDYRVSIVNAGIVGSENKSKNPAWSSKEYVTYGGATDLWSENWTASDINSSKFGIVFSVKKQGGGADPAPIIDHIQISVQYTSTLPIDLLDFNASMENDDCMITWQTATEINNDYFTIEKSRNGIDWQIFTHVLGAGDSVTPIEYSVQDNDPLGGASFYRLTQTDFDGTSETFLPAQLFNLVESKISLYPNPTHDVVHINGEDLDQTEVKIFNMNGQLQSAPLIESSSSNIRLNVNSLPTGLYKVMISKGSTSISETMSVIR